MALQALLITMEWSSALLAKKSPPRSEVIIGKVTNSSQTSFRFDHFDHVYHLCFLADPFLTKSKAYQRGQLAVDPQSAEWRLCSRVTLHGVHCAHAVEPHWITSCIVAPVHYKLYCGAGSRSNSMAAQPGKTVKATGPPNATVLRCN